MNQDPRWYGLPHATFRPSQFDAIQRIKKMYDSGGGIIFLNSPVGTGKSGISTALGVFDKVTVMTSTLELLTQYEEEYGFKAIRGRQWYPCVYKKKIDTWRGKYPPTAFDCHFSKMMQCPAAGECPYLRAKVEAISAQRAVMSYRYGALSSAMARRGGFLVFDECDVSAIEIISHAEMTITNDERLQWSFPDFPQMPTGVLEKKGELLTWLYACESVLPEPDPSNIFEMALAGDTEKKRKKLQRTIEQVEMGDWFVGIKDGVLTLKPLTAKYIAQNAYSNKRVIVCMSATIGKPTALAKQLGIGDYEFVEYEHPTPPDKRPVYCLSGIPRMSYTPEGLADKKYTIQGIMLWNFIKNNIDPKWRGIALTSSIGKANKLHAILQERFARERKVITGPTNILLEQFKSDTRNGLMAVGYMQGWARGVNLVGDLGRFSAIASVPYPSDLDPYVVAARKYDKEFYEYCVFSTIPQGTGRVTRGERNGDDWVLNVGILADRRCWDERALKYYPKWFTDSFVK